jgi:heat shock protein HtpX
MDDSRIVFTRGLLNTLNDREIEAVAGHELTHLLNKDCKLMFVGTVVVGVVSLIGEILARSSSRKDENGKGGALVLIGFALLILGNLIYPVLRLAISRKKEYLADLGSVELTHNGDAMISALEKIS